MDAQEFISKGSGVITLCGSTKYFFEVMEANRLLTFDNWIVLMCGSWGHSYHKYVLNTNTDYSTVKKLHYYKILQSNAIIVVTDSTHYYGESTKAEIKFAEFIAIPVFFFDGSKFFGSTEDNYAPVRGCFETGILESFEKNNSLGY